MDVLAELDELAFELAGGPGRLAALTTGEVEVLRLLSEGASSAAIGAELTMSEMAVASLVREILRKLGAANRTEAVSLLLATPTAGGPSRA
jgi:DNA-binding NarL/FixJ family response regulator